MAKLKYCVLQNQGRLIETQIKSKGYILIQTFYNISNFSVWINMISPKNWWMLVFWMIYLQQ